MLSEKKHLLRCMPDALDSSDGACFADTSRRVEYPSRRNVGGLRIGLFNPIAEALEFPDHSGGAVSLCRYVPRLGHKQTIGVIANRSFCWGRRACLRFS